MKINYCFECGTKVIENQKFCHNCGMELSKIIDKELVPMMYLGVPYAPYIPFYPPVYPPVIIGTPCDPPFYGPYKITCGIQNVCADNHSSVC